MMNPYKVDVEKLNESEEIKDEKDFLKLKLVSGLLKIVSKMKTEEVLAITGLHRSDLSRLKTLNVKRFTIDRIIGLIVALGFSTSIKIRAKKAS